MFSQMTIFCVYIYINICICIYYVHTYRSIYASIRAGNFTNGFTLKNHGPCFKGISGFWNMASCWRFSTQARHVGSWFLLQDSRTGGKSPGQLKRMEFWTWEEGLRFLKIYSYMYIYIYLYSKWYSASDVRGNLCCQFLWFTTLFLHIFIYRGPGAHTSGWTFHNLPKCLQDHPMK